MSRPRFLADHDLNEHIIDGLLRREPAIEFIRSRDIGLGDAPDEQVLEYAAAHGMLVVSHDLNTMPAQAYARIARDQPMVGLLMVQQLHPIALIIESLLLIWSASEAEEWQNQVRFLPF